MKDEFSRLGAYVDSLLKGRRPARFPVNPDEGEAMRMAALLRASVAGSDLPNPRFLKGLHSKLHRGGPGLSRRRLLEVAGVAAAGLVVGGVGERLLGPIATPAEIVPVGGRWLAVARSAELQSGALLAFDTGTLRGFINNRGGAVQAVSAVCTHLGCSLAANVAADRLDCPCHRTSFRPDGSVLHHQLPVSPPRLPSIRVRLNGELVEVFAP